MMLLAELNPEFILGTGEALVRLLVAAGLGAAVGLEREQHGRSAGLRTHLLVALGAAMAMVVSLHFGDVYGEAGQDSAIRVDPARVAYGVMAGIGFLGAGAIIRYGTGIRGLTTAASLWCTAAIGLGTGFGMYLVAVAATALVLFALTVLDFVDRLIPTKVTKRITLSVPGTGEEMIRRFRGILEGAGGKVVSAEFTRDFQKNQSMVLLNVSMRASHLDQVLRALQEGAPELDRMTLE